MPAGPLDDKFKNDEEGSDEEENESDAEQDEFEKSEKISIDTSAKENTTEEKLTESRLMYMNNESDTTAGQTEEKLKEEDAIKKIREEKIKKLREKEIRRIKQYKTKEKLKLSGADLSKVDHELRKTDRGQIVLNSKIEIDTLSEIERLSLCKTALKAISGQGVEFTKDSTGENRWYQIGTGIKGHHEPKFVKAFKCPSKPIAYLHVTDRNGGENTIWVIVQGYEDFRHFTSQFKK